MEKNVQVFFLQPSIVPVETSSNPTASPVDESFFLCDVRSLNESKSCTFLSKMSMSDESINKLCRVKWPVLFIPI